ncbi:MAG: 4-(cytidine 5'-diphospho)-2-C-methyl-D-erythritol kinase, partial [Myxococcota bacterium]
LLGRGRVSAVDQAAPAKVNFGLRIVGRRPDGYHELESLFLPIGLADAVRVSLRDGPGVTLAVRGDAHGVPDDGRNLAVRAAERFLAEAGRSDGVAIELTKRIPTPGGLGGGSSDAGAVLRALDRLLPGAVAPERLPGLALGLGADVPFFLDPRPALVSGIGERIEPIDEVPGFVLLLAHPGAALPTRAVYAAYDAAPASLTAPGVGPSIRALLASREQGWPWSLVRSLVRNELEPAATRLCPVVAEIRKEIEAAGALAVSLSGSGPTLFGVFPSEDAAEEAGSRVSRRPGLRTWVVKTVPSHRA